MKCPNCHSELRKGAVFCTNCGTQISRSNYALLQAVIAIYGAIMMFITSRIGVLNFQNRYAPYPVIHFIILFAICYFLHRMWVYVSVGFFFVLSVALPYQIFAVGLCDRYMLLIYRILTSLSILIIVLILDCFIKRYANKTKLLFCAVTLCSVFEVGLRFVAENYFYNVISHAPATFRGLAKGKLLELDELSNLGKTLSLFQFSTGAGNYIKVSIGCGISCLVCGIIVTSIYIIISKKAPHLMEKLR